MTETVRFIASFHDVAVMREPVEHRGAHLGVVEDAGSFLEAQVGRAHYAAVLVALPPLTGSRRIVIVPKVAGRQYNASDLFFGEKACSRR